MKNNMRKIHRNRKGISPVIATILMIMIVIIGMSIVFAYVSVYTQNYQSGIGSSVLESLTIEDVCFNGTNTVVNGISVSNMATVSVYNSGLIPVTVNGIYIDGNATTLMGTSDFNYHFYIPVGDQEVILVQGPYSQWYPGASYDVKVTTLRGSSFEKTFTA
jgi:flagellin-like protein